MKVYYDSKLAKVLRFMEDSEVVMLFGLILTEKNSLHKKNLEHSETHVLQYQDCIGLGMALGIVLMFTLFAFEIQNWWMLSIILIPFLLYYIIYGIEYLYWRIRGFKDAVSKIGFERQARWISETWNLPCEEKRHYSSLSWWKSYKD